MKIGNNTTQRSFYSEADSMLNTATGSAAAFVSVFAVTVLVILSMLLV